MVCHDTQTNLGFTDCSLMVVRSPLMLVKVIKSIAVVIAATQHLLHIINHRYLEPSVLLSEPPRLFRNLTMCISRLTLAASMGSCAAKFLAFMLAPASSSSSAASLRPYPAPKKNIRTLDPKNIDDDNDRLQHTMQRWRHLLPY